ncbi:DNA ligase [Clostridium sp. OM02-18AC]|uniref:DNA ligase n=1 Tax=Coprococcus catus TaxID=116085 RepID=A0A3E2TAS7_9FIRM|nr:DNA ligase [Coprococcus catus]RGH66372.1 DNA ligase [Ruminococcus sp. AM33-14]RHH37110.1 DNA ligase [Mediterraneibacter gnavus]RHT18367.1 DNA ligase [Clostridium sp. AM33-3]RHU19242.1 DNA ligase [Blautia sp. TM10-2]RHV64219.1 DNA ligase [Clostridium sp. OM02-18AC]
MELTEAEMRMLIWLAGWDEYTIENVLSAIRKAIAAEVKRRQQPPRP